MDYENEKSAPSSSLQDDYAEDPEYFDKLVNDVDVTYISPPLKSRIPVEKSWDS